METIVLIEHNSWYCRFKSYYVVWKQISIGVRNNNGFNVTAHVGASLVGVQDSVEYYNTSDDVKKIFKPGRTEFVRYLNTNLGKYQKYNLVVALWEGEKKIGTGTKYAVMTKTNAVEKKKRNDVNLAIYTTTVQPVEFAV